MRTIEELLSAQGGHFVWADAERAGITRREVRAALREGTLAHVGRRSYIGARRLTPEERHRRRATALLRAQPDRIATHHSAALLLDLPVYGADLEVVHFGREATSGRSGPGWVLHRLPEGVTTAVTAQATPVTTVSAVVAAVQCALAAGVRAGLVTIDAALHAGPSLHPDTRFEAALTAYSRAPGIAAARVAVGLGDGRRESPAESLAAFDLFSLHIPVTPQWTITMDGNRFRADFRVDGTNVLIEVDGTSKYKSLDDIAAEKHREGLLRDAGYEVVRLTWDDLGDLDRIRTRVSRAIARSSGRPLLP